MAQDDYRRLEGILRSDRLELQLSRLPASVGRDDVSVYPVHVRNHSNLNHNTTLTDSIRSVLAAQRSRSAGFDFRPHRQSGLSQLGHRQLLKALAAVQHRGQHEKIQEMVMLVGRPPHLSRSKGVFSVSLQHVPVSQECTHPRIFR